MTRLRNWFALHQQGIHWPTVAVSVIVFVCGVLWRQPVLLGLGAVLVCLVLRNVGTGDFQRAPSRTDDRAERFTAREHAVDDDDDEQTPPSYGALRSRRSSGNEAPKSMGALVDELLAEHRYALLLRPETKQHLTQMQIMRAVRQLDEAMSLVPAGRVLLGQLAEQSNSTCAASDTDPRLASRNLVAVHAAYLDRYCVTNEEYQQFVDAGGYEQLEFWHEEALPALLDFVDQSGAPGPRYWHDSQLENGTQRLPVVGISWYEASAYARWVGKRLPTDAEWTKAGAWPVESAPGRIAQRRYPWGESFDVRRAHLYGSGEHAPAAVDDYPGGVSVGGIHQLIGNVWEWTSTPLVELGDPTLHVSESVISIRGGAFDTYFENQATCHYQSGEHPLSRRANIGFRLALPMCDLESNVKAAPAQFDDESDLSESQADVALTC